MTESIAAQTLLRWITGYGMPTHAEPVTTEQAHAAAVELATRAVRALGAGITPERVDAVFAGEQPRVVRGLAFVAPLNPIDIRDAVAGTALEPALAGITDDDLTAAALHILGIVSPLDVGRDAAVGRIVHQARTEHDAAERRPVAGAGDVPAQRVPA